MECMTHDSHLVRKPTASGGWQYTHQCRRCGGIDYSKTGHGPWVPKPAQCDVDSLPLWDDELQRHIAEHSRLLSEENRDEQRDERRRMYEGYLESDEWAARRAFVLKRDRYLCQGCLECEATEVHHLTYERLFDELLCDLVSLCRDCHRKCHPYKDLRGRELDGYAIAVH